jgi:hypothetical protein
MLSRQEEETERRRVFAQDQSVQRQATTMHQFAQSEAETPRGRFSAVDNATVVGAQPTTNYPAAAAHQHDPVPKEEPLGYRIDAMPELEATSSAPQATDPTSDDAPTPLGQRADVGSLSSRRTYRRR